jgi:hypothetical protein
MLALLAYSMLALQDATVKWLVDTVPVWQVLFLRSALLVLGCSVAGGRPLLLHAVTTPTWALLARRGAVTLAAWVCYFNAALSPVRRTCYIVLHRADNRQSSCVALIG